MSRLRLIFMGSPDFAMPALDRLIGVGHDIACVYAQPPRPAGRGQKLHPVPVHAFATERGLSVRTPINLKEEEEQRAFAALGADAAVVAAYGLILPETVLVAPRLGCLNIHASLLPRWRGAAPIHRAILEGDAETGITIMQMNAGLDTGDILLQQSLAIGPDATTAGLHDALAQVGADLMVRALDDLDGGRLRPLPQNENSATYAPKITPEDARLDWTRPAEELERQIRALAPKTFFEHAGERIRVHQAEAVTEAAAEAVPGTVLDGHLTVACGSGALRLLSLQRAGKTAQETDAFLRGYALDEGVTLA